MSRLHRKASRKELEPLALNMVKSLSAAGLASSALQTDKQGKYD